MLTAEDKAMLKQLGKECREAGMPIGMLISYLLSQSPAFFSTVHMICVTDDGTIDPEEAKLLTWARTFLFRVKDKDIYEEIIPLLSEG